MIYPPLYSNLGGIWFRLNNRRQQLWHYGVDCSQARAVCGYKPTDKGRGHSVSVTMPADRGKVCSNCRMHVEACK